MWFVATNSSAFARSHYRKTYIDLKKREREWDASRLNISVCVGFYRGDEFYFRHKINLREGRAGDIISNGGKKWLSNGAVNAPFGQNKCCVRLRWRSIALYFHGESSIFVYATNIESKRCSERNNVLERSRISILA